MCGSLVLAPLISAILSALTIPSSSFAEIQTVIAEATYQLGDGETPAFGETMVLRKAKQIALEEAGTYVASYLQIKTFDLARHEIQTVAGGVMEVEVLERTRTLVGDALRFYVKIKATVTTDKMEELARHIRGRTVAEEYRELQAEYARLGAEIDTWKKLLAKMPPGPERDAAFDQIRAREKAFSDLQHTEGALFKRLLAGDAIVSQATEERAQVDALIQRITDHGHTVRIGKPSAQVHQHGASLADRQLTLDIPITVEIAATLLSTVMDAAESLGGAWVSLPVGMPYSGGRVHLLRYLVPEIMFDQLDFTSGERTLAGGYRSVSRADDRGRFYDRPLGGTVVQLSSTPVTNAYFASRLGRLALVVRLGFKDGQPLSCKVPFIINRIFPVNKYGFTSLVSGLGKPRELAFVSDEHFVTSLYEEATQRNLAFTENELQLIKSVQDYVAVLPERISLRISFRLPEWRIRELEHAEAYFAEVESRGDLSKDVCLTTLEHG
jgi:hypothetical protein